MNSDELLRVVRQVPGVNRVRRWQKGYREDRGYIQFSVSIPEQRVYVDLIRGTCMPPTGWQVDPHGLGARAVRTIRSLCEQYRAAMGRSA